MKNDPVLVVAEVSVALSNTTRDFDFIINSFNSSVIIGIDKSVFNVGQVFS